MRREQQKREQAALAKEWNRLEAERQARLLAI